jgi:hypothetical protein
MTVRLCTRLGMRHHLLRQAIQNVSVQADQAFVYDDSQKLGYTATVFVILNKMIGTGSESSRAIYEETKANRSTSLLHTIWHLRCLRFSRCITVLVDHWRHPHVRRSIGLHRIRTCHSAIRW